MFVYHGYGNFTVHWYNYMAILVTQPTIDPMDFFRNEYSNILIMDEFIYGQNQGETERYIGCSQYNAFKHDPEEFLMVMTNSATMDNLVNTVTIPKVSTFIKILYFLE